MKYKIVTQGIKEVEGEPIKIVDYADTFIHQVENNNWMVSEVKTGRSLSNGGWENQNFAIREAKSLLERMGEEALKEEIKEFTLKN